MSGIWWSHLDSSSGGTRNNTIEVVREAHMLRNREKTATSPPKPEGQFWQAADGDGGDPRRPNPRAATPRSGHSPGPGPTHVRDAAGDDGGDAVAAAGTGGRSRLRSLPDADQCTVEYYPHECGGSRRPIPRREAIAFADLALGPEIGGGLGSEFREKEEGCWTTGRDRLSPTTVRV